MMKKPRGTMPKMLGKKTAPMEGAAAMPDFMQRAARPGGMKKGGMVAMPKGMKPAKKGKY